MSMETIEYSVCEDCLLYVANGDVTENLDDQHVDAAIKREIDGRNAHFNAGVEPTEDDPEGQGYDEFSSHSCELCNTYLAGSRHGITLLIQE